MEECSNNLTRHFKLTYIFSSDEEPVKKVPLKQIVKPDTDKMKKPQKTNNNNFAKKEIKPLENDYRSERDQRTIFVKNLPFSSSVDDVSTCNTLQVTKKYFFVLNENFSFGKYLQNLKKMLLIVDSVSTEIQETIKAWRKLLNIYYRK